MRPLRLDHAAIRVPDLEAARSYYCEAVGLMQIEVEGDTAYLACGGDPGFDLSLRRDGVGLDHLALALPGAQELDQAEQALRLAGIPLQRLEGAEPQVAEAIRFRIPTGHEVELMVAARASSYLHPTDWQRPAIHAPLDVNHVTLMARDVKEVAQFLQGHLDFRLSDVFEPAPDVWGAAFLRVGENHHDIAVLGGEGNWLHHVAFEVTDISSLLAFSDRLVRCGYRAEYGIGRHGPGGNVFLYARDPAGNRLELTCGAARVTDPATPTRFWRGDFLDIVNVWAPLPPPESFGRGT